MQLDHGCEDAVESTSRDEILGCRQGGWGRIEHRIEYRRGALTHTRQRVAALEQECETAAAEFLGELPHDRGHRGETRATEPHVCEGIVRVGIEAARDQHELRSKPPGRRDQDSLEDADVLGVAATRRHRDVEGVAAAAPSPDFRGSAGSGVVGILVGRDVEDTRILFERMLAAVAVMDIPVQNQNAFYSVLGLERPSRDGDVVDQAETHCAVRFGMVSGWTDRGHARSGVSGGDPSNEVDAAAGCEQRDFQTFRADVGVRIELRGCPRAAAGDPVEMDRIVDSPDLFRGRGSRCERFEPIAARRDRIADRNQAFGAFRVSRGAAVVEKSRIFDDGGYAAGCHRGQCYPSRDAAANSTGGSALNEPGVIGITGLRSFLGEQLALRLLRRSPQLRIVGFDQRRPLGIDSRIRFHAVDLTAPDAAAEMAERLRDERVEALVHAAFRTDSTADLARDRALETDGSLRVIDACIEARVSRLVLASSTMLYGPRHDNPNFLTEDHPLRGHPDAHVVANRIEVESLLADCARRVPQLEVTVLRSCWVLGPRFDDRVSRYFAMPVVPKLLGYDPMLQFVHEEDQLDAFEQAALSSHPGVFNVVGRGILPLATLLRLGGRRPIALPARLLYRMAYTPGPSRTGDPPAAFYDYLRYLWVADGSRGWDAFGEPVYSTRETWIEFVSARKSRRAG